MHQSANFASTILTYVFDSGIGNRPDMHMDRLDSRVKKGGKSF